MEKIVKPRGITRNGGRKAKTAKRYAFRAGPETVKAMEALADAWNLRSDTDVIERAIQWVAGAVTKP